MMKSSRLVYSTATGKSCGVCEKPVASCSCSTAKTAQVYADGILRIRRETKGRKGKGVTLVDGLPLSAPEMDALARQLKNKCGSGGTVKDGMIEIQGDHRTTVQEFLQQAGFKTKLAGA
jgi:translation initiation factor 1